MLRHKRHEFKAPRKKANSVNQALMFRRAFALCLIECCFVCLFVCNLSR